MDERTVSALAERVEAESLAAWFDCASPAVHRNLGLDYLRVGGGVASVTSPGPLQPLWSRSVGFGWSEPVTDEVVEAVVDLHRRHGSCEVRFQVSPWVRGEWETTLETHGFTPDVTWVKLARDTAPPPEAFTTLRVRELTSADAAAYAEVYTKGFGYDRAGSSFAASVKDWARSQIGSSGWRVFGAFDDDHMVGCASMFVAGESAAFLGATTLPTARHRGAQSALLVERLRCAAQLGRRWVTTEISTGSGSAGTSTLNNLRRMGFAALYERRNWVTDLSGETSSAPVRVAG